MDKHRPRKRFGQNFLTDLRTRAANRRNPWMDAGASVLSGISSGIGAGGAAAGGAAASAGAGAAGIGKGMFGSLMGTAPNAGDEHD